MLDSIQQYDLLKVHILGTGKLTNSFICFDGPNNFLYKNQIVWNSCFATFRWFRPKMFKDEANYKDENEEQECGEQLDCR